MIYLTSNISNFIRCIENEYGEGSIKGIELNVDAYNQLLFEASYLDIHCNKVENGKISYMKILGVDIKKVID